MVLAKTTIYLHWRRWLVLIVCHGFSFATSTLALNRIALSFLYAVRAVVGLLPEVARGIVCLKGPVSAPKIIWMAFIVVSFIDLHGSGIAY